MNVARGSIVLVDFPFAGGGPSKVRPALMVQNDRDNRRLHNTMVVMISSRVTRSGTEASQVFVDLSEHGIATGLRVDSVINCVNVSQTWRLACQPLTRCGSIFESRLRAVASVAIRSATGEQ